MNEMSGVCGTLLLAGAVFVAMLNFFFAFLRPPLYRFFSWDLTNESGIPVLGTISLCWAMLLMKQSVYLWSVAIFVLFCDPGGLLWAGLSYYWHQRKS